MRWITAILCGISTTSLWAGDVSISKVHICCDSCVSAVDEALADVKGVSNVAAVKDTKTIAFTAADDKAAEAGIAALAKHGFFGQAKHGTKKMEFPSTGAKKGEKSNQIELYGVHLCCGACVLGAKESLKNVGGLSVIEVDRAGGKITLKGAGMETAKALDALNAGGFYASLKKDEKKEDKKETEKAK